jgi:hypothetical protein
MCVLASGSADTVLLEIRPLPFSRPITRAKTRQHGKTRERAYTDKDASIFPKLRSPVPDDGHFQSRATTKPAAEHGTDMEKCHLTPRWDIPIIPIVVNAFAPPMPSPKRCSDVGAFTADVSSPCRAKARSLCPSTAPSADPGRHRARGRRPSRDGAAQQSHHPEAPRKFW